MPAIVVCEPPSQSVRAIIMSTFIKSWGVGRGRSVPLSALTTSITSGWHMSLLHCYGNLNSPKNMCLVVFEVYFFLPSYHRLFASTQHLPQMTPVIPAVRSLGKPPGESVTGSTLRGHNPQRRRRRWRRARLDGHCNGHVASPLRDRNFSGLRPEWRPHAKSAISQSMGANSCCNCSSLLSLILVI